MSIITIPPEVVEAAAKAMALHDAKGDPQRGDFRWREYGHAYVSAAQVALAAALAAWRPAIRAEALEEAASKADYWQKNYRLGETKRVKFDRRDMNSVISGTAQCIAEDIRALKVLAK